MRKQNVSLLFYIAAVYDGCLGLAFLFFTKGIFEGFKVTPPNHYGYVQFPAALLVIFGLMFLAIARNPVMNRNLIPYGILLKVAYCSIAFFYWFTTGIPGLWKPFAVFDAIFAVLFAAAYRGFPRQESLNT